MESRHAEVTKALIKEITTGLYPIGSSLPGELELAEIYGVSRGTIRTALARIEELGMVSRKKRAGTRVEAVAPRSSDYRSQLSTINELVQYGKDTERTVHAAREIVMDLALAEKTGCQPGTRWLDISTSRKNPEHPDRLLSWSNIYVPAADGELIKSRLKSTDDLVYDLVAQTTGRVVKEVRQSIRAVGVPKELAPLLGTSPEAHALEFVRQYIDQSDSMFEVAVSIHPADRFTYFTVLRRQTE
ncbi:GntR family transcriptional regulator [Noviherbaspirillum sp. CPCC 100848]|uniref:GntR family transcriptional regulator n=1 Tax=Noviherbaspirillum album TaxID=3080276 RepID=A0ABU6JH13_9BURK|nr:GntR family transcriptional regulator [Noviherbaspirillum sp. CPCC 100848]MEC4722820.1 GntR family transcriptional regulator [Noviherbaspirillum sp. CPCC 100848]